MAVYVFQRTDIIGGGRGGYIEMVRSNWAAHAQRQYGIRLVGVWATVGSTANWPEANILWEMDDWNHFACAQQAQFPMEDRDPYGLELWRHSLQWQSGGEGALLLAATFSPSLSDIKAKNINDGVVLRENVRSKPGGMAAYHQALEAEYLPLAESRGLRLLGAYSHAIEPNVGMNLWTLQRWEDLPQLMESEATHSGVGRWMSRAATLLDDLEGWLLAPPPQDGLRT